MESLPFFSSTVSAALALTALTTLAGNAFAQDSDGDGLSDAAESPLNRYQLVYGVGWSYGDALAYGQSVNMELASISSAAEWAAVESVFNLPARTDIDLIILGGDDFAEEGTFAWDSGEPFAYTNWSSGEPNNWMGMDEKHVAVFGAGVASGSLYGQWTDIASPPLSSPYPAWSLYFLFESGYYSDPANPDTDGDDIVDGDEQRFFNTFPDATDSDGDGVPDGKEAFIFGTSPSLADTTAMVSTTATRRGI